MARRFARGILIGLLGFARTTASLQQKLSIGRGSIGRSSHLAMASTTDVPTTTTKVTVLALHGSGGQAASFEQNTLGQWKEYLAAPTANIKLEITSVQGHVPKEDGYAWWFLPPGLRSSTADTYQGFDESCKLVADAFANNNNGEAFDLVIGHSQGAILLASLLALGKIERHPRRVGYILNGVAWPNPYTQELEALQIMGGDDSVPPRVLVLIGEKDAMNPPEQGERVANALRQAGCDVTTVVHPRGHAVPVQNDATWNAIQAWILKGMAEQ